MNCRQYRSGLIEMGRGEPVSATAHQLLAVHLNQCPECTRFLESQKALTAAMEDLSAVEIPPASEFFGPVMAEFDRVHPARHRAGVVAIRWAVVAGLAAALTLGVIVTRRHEEPSRPVPARAVQKTTVRPEPSVASLAADKMRSPAPRTINATLRPKASPEPEQPFYPIPFTAPLAPGEWTRVERMKFPVAALIAAGFHLQVLDPSAVVEADALVSQDGRVRAIRPVSVSNSN
jgi:hypothetical protein